MKSTEFYNRNAEAFYDDTAETDMTAIYERFLPLLRPGALILDAGCGSGRDTRAFLQRGYLVDAFDGSAEMARRASDLTGISVQQMMFEDLLESPLRKRYDAIWCCASLLHLERNVLPKVLETLLNALVPAGVMYVSFKYGETERIKDGRHFTDLTKESLDQMLATLGGCALADSWVTNDQRPERADMWLNAIVRLACI